MLRGAHRLLCLAVIWTVWLASAAPGAEREIRFNRDIRPILSNRCFKCHGPDLKKAGLDLRSFTGATQKLKSGRSPVVPGKSSASELIARVSGEGTERMPPKGDPLTPDQIATLKAWIDQGAKYEEHWAYVKPVRPQRPEVKNIGWIRNGIDYFVLARLEKEGLTPNAEADRAVLLRRVSLDLTGLPPSVEEVDTFLKDNSPDAYEKAVDRLLDSPHYGEHQARYWLDQARYADTNGYEKDERRTIWPYRDWVINAFNRDLTFDKFTIEQIAGDLLPHATVEQKTATGFHRNTMVNTEGGTDDEEFRVAAIVDRVNTTMEVWMGSTFACAQCHNHKFDPFTQKDYYQLFAFFNNTTDKGRSNDPQLRVPSKPPATTLVLQELPMPRVTKIMIRGNHKNLGGPVRPDTPAVLHPLPKDGVGNRLTLARWLIDPANPLTPRVTLNRIWARYFGKGFVETSEDFGIQGDLPTHPELLDWLATEFIARGWSLKAMHRLIVTSATYRQSARVTLEQHRRDPFNRLFARGPRFRLDAEMVRDNALAISGLLNRKLGGPSVFPYQPDGVWFNPYSSDKWVTSTGGDQYRRGLYTFWRRTSPYAAFIAFDAPSREVACERRPRTNTPLQALATLNDKVFIEASAALARRILAEGKGGDRERLTYGFRLCVARTPTARELEVLGKLYTENLEKYRKDMTAAQAMAKNGGQALPKDVDIAEVAAWTVVANVLLNLDETITKG
jgi:hypothetical protein